MKTKVKKVIKLSYCQALFDTALYYGLSYVTAEISLII